MPSQEYQEFHKRQGLSKFPGLHISLVVCNFFFVKESIQYVFTLEFKDICDETVRMVLVEE